MPRFLVTANFNVEAENEKEAEELFEDYLADSAILTDTKSVAFECVEAVILDNEEAELADLSDDEEDGPDAMLRPAA